MASLSEILAEQNKSDHKPTTAGGVAYQIPRNSLALLMVAQLVVILPHGGHLPIWVIAVVLFCGYWRTQVFRGRWDYPRRWIKVLLVVGSITGVAISGLGGFSLEAATLFLVLGYALKLIEMKNRRDAYVVIFLSYFVIATEFLFDQSIAVAAYEMVAVVVVTAAMVGMNQLQTRVRPLASLKLATSLVAQAIPFTLVLFVFFPRIGPQWPMPVPNSAKTGISQSMKPGDIANLSQSDELAFFAVFQGPPPALNQLYWRGLIYPHFGDGTWSAVPLGQTLKRVANARLQTTENERAIDYEIIMQPTANRWLFGLAAAQARSTRIVRTTDHRLFARQPIMSVFRYRVNSYPEHRRSDPPGLSSRQLPPDDNPRVRALAKQLFAQSRDQNDYVRRVLTLIAEDGFYYTLQPPTLTERNSVDQFWFDTKRGFCTHYAGAFVYFMRAAGIPARMVGGYQGGTRNTRNNNIVVRQYDAHAWAEVWGEDEGWRRVDPTASVAPARIEQGLRAALSEEDRAALSLWVGGRFGEMRLIGDVIEWFESMEHAWNLWVVGFDNNQQQGFLQRMLGKITAARMGFAMLGAGGICMGLVTFILFWRRRPARRHPVERVFGKFCTTLEKQGLPRRLPETPAVYLGRLGDQFGLDGSAIRSLIVQLNDLLYDPTISWDRLDLMRLRRQLRMLRLKVALQGPRAPAKSS